MKRETLFLRIVVFLIGIPIIALCVMLTRVGMGVQPDRAYLIYPVLAIVFATVIPFFAALYQTLKLLGYIDKNKAFSDLSIKAIKFIKYCAITITILYVIGMIPLYIWAEVDDAPGIILFGLISGFASFVIAAFAAVLQKLLKNAIDIKNDNDLTI
jgi:hypothetical protein